MNKQSAWWNKYHKLNLIFFSLFLFICLIGIGGVSAVGGIYG